MPAAGQPVRADAARAGPPRLLRHREHRHQDQQHPAQEGSRGLLPPRPDLLAAGERVNTGGLGIIRQKTQIDGIALNHA